MLGSASITNLIMRSTRSEAAMVARSMSGNGGSIVKSALMRGAVGTGVGAAYGGATNPDGNWAGGAFSGALKMGALSTLGVGGGLAGARIYATRFAAGGRNAVRRNVGLWARNADTKILSTYANLYRKTGGGKKLW